MFSALIAMSAVLAQPDHRSSEGDWYVSDQTDNNTGEREVYARQFYLRKEDPNYVTLTMRCSKGKPTLFVEWADLDFPDQTVLTIGPVASPDSEPADEQYVFGRSSDVMERGLEASPGTSAKIVSAIGRANYLTVTAHLASGTRIVGIKVNGTQGAWSRVSRHCPVQIMQRPPL